MRTLTRRRLLGLGLGTATAGALGGCATPGTASINAQPTIPAKAAGETITLTYWAWLKDLQKVADIWNVQRPDIQVKVAWIPGGNAGGYQKLHSALAANGGPDMAQIEMRSIPEFMLVNGLVDLTRYGANEFASSFDPTLWGQVSFTGGVYGIPQDSGPMGWYYQPEILDRVGAPVPKTWDEWAEVAREVRKTQAYLECFPLSDASLFCSLAGQAGAAWLKPDENGWVITMTDDATLSVARFFDKVVDEGLVTTEYAPYSPAWFAACSRGGLAALTGASWSDALVEGVAGGSGKWRVAPMPRWSTGFGSTYLGGSTTAVMASSAHPREALEFAVWLNSSPEGVDALISNSGIGWSANPHYIGASRTKPSAFFSGERYNENVFVPAAQQQNPDWTWWPITQQSFNIISDGFRRKASGGTFVDAIAQAEDLILRAFQNKGLTIRKGQA
ncbi:MAG: extracellular solute-binding protein [Propioniciclava sp.]|uniref:extracellular solute-binding protein n=1 Tax=Propioniciclava sp. TaxID=2038686 RepID=UPI0039E3BC14